jgi:hypothetical protein
MVVIIVSSSNASNYFLQLVDVFVIAWEGDDGRDGARFRRYNNTEMLEIAAD